MRKHRNGRRAAVASVMVLSVLLAACGGGTSESGAANRGALTDPIPEEPAFGGHVVMAMESETGGGFTPATAVWDVSGYLRANAVLEPLFKPAYVDEERTKVEYRPWLAESATPSADYTSWDIVLRPDIKLHNGETLDAELVKKNLDSARNGEIAAGILFWIASVDVVDDMTVRVNTVFPYVTLPAVLSGQAGYIVADEQLQASVAAPDGTSNHPIGTGPFRLVEYVPGSVNFLAERFDGYWRTDRDGRQLPYLDSVEFQTIPDTQVRREAFRSGRMDILTTSTGTDVAEMRASNDTFRVFENEQFTELGYILLNSSKAPLDDIRIRKALALSLDVEALNKQMGDASTRANGPFSPGSIGYLDDTGWPMKPDMAEAKRLVEEYKAEKGVTTVEFPFVSVPTTDALRLLQIMQAMWKEAGITVTLNQVEQSAFIGLAVSGDFHAFTWRNHWGADPAQQAMWWFSAFGQGDQALNFGRINDPVIDENLLKTATDPNPDTRRAAAENINRRFAEQFYNIWMNYTNWVYATHPDVIGMTVDTFPDGTPVATGIGGHEWLTEVWLNQGE